MCLTLCAVCLDAEAVRKNPVMSRASNLEVESFVKKWLRNASDRMGGRSARMKKMLEKKQRAKTTHDNRPRSNAVTTTWPPTVPTMVMPVM